MTGTVQNNNETYAELHLDLLLQRRVLAMSRVALMIRNPFCCLLQDEA